MSDLEMYEAQREAHPETKSIQPQVDNLEQMRQAINEALEAKSTKLSGVLPEIELISADLPSAKDTTRVDAMNLRNKVQSIDSRNPESGLNTLATEIGKITDADQRQAVVKQFNEINNGLNVELTKDGKLNVNFANHYGPLHGPRTSRYTVQLDPKSGAIVDVKLTPPDGKPVTCEKGSAEYKNAVHVFNIKMTREGYRPGVRGLR